MVLIFSCIILVGLEVKRLSRHRLLYFVLLEVTYRPKKYRPKFSPAQIFVTLGKFRHLGPANNLGRRKFGLFLKFYIAVKFVFKYDISSYG